MPRKRIVRSNEHPYHITARVNNREEFACGVNSAWFILCFHLNELCILFEIKVHAFVVMSNHYHLLMTTPKHDLDKVMQKFMWSITKSINTKSGRTGRVFGSRYHWSMVTSLGHFDCVQKYVYRNPVKAGLVQRVEDYHYSSLKDKVLGKQSILHLSPVYDEYSIVPGEQHDEFLGWLNQAFANEEYISIQKALRRSAFAPK